MEVRIKDICWDTMNNPAWRKLVLLLKAKALYGRRLHP